MPCLQLHRLNAQDQWITDVIPRRLCKSSKCLVRQLQLIREDAQFPIIVFEQVSLTERMHQMPKNP